MRLHLELLRKAHLLRHILRRDGWELKPQRNHSYSARHPAVADEPAARNRLWQLGLLTSRLVRVDFLKAGRG